MKTSLDDVLMTGTGFGVNSNCFATAGEDPSPTSSSFSFDTLERFPSGWFSWRHCSCHRNQSLGHAYRVTQDKNE
jgi:hypothetical protein